LQPDAPLPQVLLTAYDADDTDRDGIETSSDCNDIDPSVYPGADQRCDGVNNDCDDPAWPALPTNESDADGDGRMICAGDCDDANAATYPGAVETNDGFDNQCPGDPGYGAADEISGDARIGTEGDRDRISWPEQPGATRYEVVRATSPRFESDCQSFSTDVPWISDSEEPPSGSSFFYLVRVIAPFTGSWGLDDEGVERSGICPGPEVDQSNLISTGNIVLSRDQVVGQTLTVGVSGTLVGIEFAPLLDSGSPSDELAIEIRDAGGALLGTSSILASAFPPGSGIIPDPLLLDATGAGYFDVSELGVHVIAGQTISFTLVPHFAPGVCNPITHKCTSGKIGRPCFSNFECDKSFRAGESNQDAYTGGAELVNGVPSSYFDLAFKTIVSPP